MRKLQITVTSDDNGRLFNGVATVKLDGHPGGAWECELAEAGRKAATRRTSDPFAEFADMVLCMEAR